MPRLPFISNSPARAFSALSVIRTKASITVMSRASSGPFTSTMIHPLHHTEVEKGASLEPVGETATFPVWGTVRDRETLSGRPRHADAVPHHRAMRLSIPSIDGPALRMWNRPSCLTEVEFRVRPGRADTFFAGGVNHRSAGSDDRHAISSALKIRSANYAGYSGCAAFCEICFFVRSESICMMIGGRNLPSRQGAGKIPFRTGIERG